MLRRVHFALWLSALSACSFIDDFDRFRVADAGEDDARDAAGGEDEDAGGEDEDAGGVDEDGSAQDPDAGESDAGSEGDAALAPGDLECRGKPDGFSCGDGKLICRKGFCRTSRCGDGFIDKARNEKCDDANLVAGDGCEPSSCQFSCEDNLGCDNQYPCDGEERCEVSSHRCMPDTGPGTGLPCKRGEQDGTCDNTGYCLTPGCGDGVVSPGEACDPKRAPLVPGCRTDCTVGCTSDDKCADADACNGSETCDLSTGNCKPGTKLACIDDDPCSQNGVCVAASGCTFLLIDSDGDQVSEQTCSAGSPFKGGDCDGKSAAIYPGATEYCDGADNDCDGMRDENAVMATCYPDADGDGFPTRQGAAMHCTCPAGTRLARADGLWDCGDDPRRAGGDVYPTQDAYFAVGYEVTCPGGNGTCVSFDYNCDTAETGQYPAGTNSCGLLNLPCSGGGYNGAPPACGQEAAYLICQSGGLLGGCGMRYEQRRQVCR
jgi:cysteine-rich repeat protein